MENTSPPKKIVINDQVASNITRAEELVYDIKIYEAMKWNVITVSPDTKMRELVNIFRTERISGAPVIENDELVGVISLEDLINCLVKTDLASDVKKYMTPKPLTVRATDPLVEALKKFADTQVGRLPVVDRSGKLVGIITKGDITLGLLKTIQRYHAEEELRLYRASHLFEDIESDRTSLILRYNIRPRDFTHGGAASSHIKRALIRLGASPQIARRCGIAIYEAEMNLIIHTTNGGTIRVEIEPHRISMRTYDDGPGIENIELAMQPGYSTASDEVRELGFGAGMGLVNISRCVDNMELESEPNKGTLLRMKIFLKKDESFQERPAEN
jgi:CBS domain-containing protein/anti-sigma regulatory factor (Ser/Thr protein kinase)